MGRRRGEVCLDTLPDAERLRRQRQRDLRKLALQLRNNGVEYEKTRIDRGQLQKPKRDAAHGCVEKSKQHRQLVAPDFEVVILPIFWNQRQTEKRLIAKRAAEAEAYLAAAAVSVHLDATNKFTPGQRMRHWEECGVKVRVEIGPRDAEAAACVLARSQPVAGRVAYKEAASIDARLAGRVQELLAMPDAAVPEGDEAKYRAAGGVDNAGEGKGEVGRESGARPVGLGHPHARVGAPETARHIDRGPSDSRCQPTGDDLEDDFGEVLGEDRGTKKLSGRGSSRKGTKTSSVCDSDRPRKKMKRKG